MLTSLLDADDAAAAPSLEGAGFWIRAVARILDLLVHIAVSIVAGFVTGIVIVVVALMLHADASVVLARIGDTQFLGYVAALLGGLWLHVSCEGLHGSSLGKRICGLTVVDESGGPAKMMAAARRDLAFYVDSLFFGVVAWNKMKESPRRQRIGDIWGHTLVVRIKDLPEASRRSALRFVGAFALGVVGDGVILSVELISRVV
jgi:uncharacterized RDD family membrane protein YckC